MNTRMYENYDPERLGPLVWVTAFIGDDPEGRDVYVPRDSATHDGGRLIGRRVFMFRALVLEARLFWTRSGDVGYHCWDAEFRAPYIATHLFDTLERAGAHLLRREGHPTWGEVSPDADYLTTV